MNDLTLLAPSIVLGKEGTLSAESVRGLVAFINASDIIKRWILLHLFETKAHLVVLCNSFEEFCDKELKMGYSKNYYSDLVRAARAERAIFGNQTIESLSSPSFPKTSLRVLLIMATIPEQHLKSAWQEYKERHDSPACTPTHAINQLKSIAARHAANVPQEETVDIAEVSPPAETPDAPSAPRLVDPFKEEVKTEPTKPDFPDTAAAPAKPSAVPSAVSSFTPKPDAPCYEERKTIDWEEAEWLMELSSSWVKTRKKDGPRQSRCNAAEMLRLIADWLEDDVS